MSNCARRLPKVITIELLELRRFANLQSLVSRLKSLRIVYAFSASFEKIVEITEKDYGHQIWELQIIAATVEEFQIREHYR